MRLVVDHGRLWIPPQLQARARARNTENHALTSPRVLAWRARHEGNGVRPATEPAVLEARREAADLSPRRSPDASLGRWLLAVPYLTGAVAALVGWLLAYLFGGVR